MKTKVLNWFYSLKDLGIWISIIMYLEFIFMFVIFDSYLRISVVDIFIHSLIIGIILDIINHLFKDKVNKIVTGISLFILGLAFSLQLVFYRIFKSFFSFSVLGLGNQLKSFLGQTIKCILSNLPYIIILFLPFIFFLIYKKRMSFKRYKWSNNLSHIFMLIFLSLLYILNIYWYKNSDYSAYNLYFKVNEVSLNIEKLGVISAYNLDIYRSLFGFDIPIVKTVDITDDSEELIDYDYNVLNIDFSKKTGNSNIKTINSYMENETGTKKNKYTGLFKDYNLIYITAESFSQIGVSEELTPTLYKLINTGFKFNNFYTPNNLSTIGGEFQSLTGLYPDSSILTTWRKGTNYYPYGLSTTFKSIGYNTYAYHNNWYGFQDRHKYLKSQGFTNYLGCYNGLEKRMNCKQWPQSDDEMIRVTTDDYINSDKPFLAYYMTVSGHFEYNFNANNMAQKHQTEVKNLNLSTSAKAYVATQIELDKALERLLKTLEEKEILDNTVIVLLADHYPYELSLKDINSLSSYQRDNVVEINHNSLILWNSRLKNINIDKACMSVDVIPTVYNLFGIDYDSRLIIGNDILSSKEGLAVFKNRSWVSDSGTFYANSGKFVAKEEVDENYVSNINKIVSNRLNVSKLIIKSDYYRYLMK